MIDESRKEIEYSIYYNRIMFYLLRFITRDNPGPYDYNYLRELFYKVKKEYNIKEEAPYDVSEYCEAVISYLVEGGIFERIGEGQFRRIVFFESLEDIEQYNQLRGHINESQNKTTSDDSANGNKTTSENKSAREMRRRRDYFEEEH